MTAEQTFYAEIGGHETVARIVEVFYEGVAEDPVLRPLYPEDDLGPAAALAWWAAAAAALAFAAVQARAWLRAAASGFADAPAPAGAL